MQQLEQVLDDRLRRVGDGLNGRVMGRAVVGPQLRIGHGPTLQCHECEALDIGIGSTHSHVWQVDAADFAPKGHGSPRSTAVPGAQPRKGCLQSG